MGYIMKDEGLKKFKIDKWGIPRHPPPSLNPTQIFRLWPLEKTYNKTILSNLEGRLLANKSLKNP